MRKVFKAYGPFGQDLTTASPMVENVTVIVFSIYLVEFLYTNFKLSQNEQIWEVQLKIFTVNFFKYKNGPPYSSCI